MYLICTYVLLYICVTGLAA